MPKTSRTAAPLAGNRDVADLLSILREQSSPSLADFQKLLEQVGTLEQQLEAAVRELAAMRRDLAEMERRRHPAVNAMRKAVIIVQAQVLELLLELKGDMTYLFIAHDVQAVTYLCDHIMFLHEGTIAESLEKEHLARASSGYAQRLLQSVIPFNPDACVATV